MVKSKNPVDQATLLPIAQTPYLDVESKSDTENKEAQTLQGKAAILLDPTLNPIKAIGEQNPLHVQLADGATLAALGWLGLLGDSPNTSTIPVTAMLNLWDQAQNKAVAVRNPTVYKNVQTAANGSTAIWTSAVGKKWRLMGVVITLGQATTAAAGVKVSLLDVAADTGIGVTVSTAALAAVPNTVIILSIQDMKNGILAAATNTALNVNLSSAMAVNGVSVQVWGTEE